jgi:hypothetical protein
MDITELRKALEEAYPKAEVWGGDEKYMSGNAAGRQSLGLGIGWTEKYYSDGRKDGYYEDHEAQYEIILEGDEVEITRVNNTPGGMSFLGKRTVLANAEAVINAIENL